MNLNFSANMAGFCRDSHILHIQTAIMRQLMNQETEGRGGWGGGVGREEEKPPQVKTRGDQLPTDGPDHTTRPKGHHSGQG